MYKIFCANFVTQPLLTPTPTRLCVQLPWQPATSFTLG